MVQLLTNVSQPPKAFLVFGFHFGSMLQVQALIMTSSQRPCSHSCSHGHVVFNLHAGAAGSGGTCADMAALIRWRKNATIIREYSEAGCIALGGAFQFPPIKARRFGFQRCYTCAWNLMIKPCTDAEVVERDAASGRISHFHQLLLGGR